MHPGVHYLIQSGQGFRAIEDNLTQFLAVNLTTVSQDFATELVNHSLPHLGMGLEGLVANLISTQHHRAKPGQKTSNGTLATANAASKAYDFHNQVCHLFSHATPHTIKQGQCPTVNTRRLPQAAAFA
jgi:hypothetical protein